MAKKAAFSSWKEIEDWLGALVDLEQMAGATRGAFVRSEKPVQRVLMRVGLWPYPIPMIHLVGSKGKGSVAWMCECLLQVGGVRTGLYQSPHLVERRERIKIDGEMASVSLWGEGLRSLAEAVVAEGLSRFEAETVLAFWLFAREGVEVVICEAGLGGVGDATSAVQARLVCLTSVEQEHTELLGEDLAGIVLQKAGVIAEGGLLAVGPLPHQAMRAVLGLCRERSVRLLEVGVDLAVVRTEPVSDGTWVTCEGGERQTRTQHRFFLSLLGAHQPYMAALAILVVQTFVRQVIGQLWSWSWVESLGSLCIPARLESLPSVDGLILLDTAHTPRSVQASLDACLIHKQQPPACVLLALSQDKRLVEILALVASACPLLILVPNPGPRGVSMETLREVAQVELPAHLELYPDIPSAFQALQQHLLPNEVGLITGSFRLAGAILSLLRS